MIILDGHDFFFSVDCERAVNRVLAENKRLKEFARHIICQYCWNIDDPDGGDIQGWAEKLRLIVPHVATAEDVDDESDFEVGDTIFKFSELLQETGR